MQRASAATQSFACALEEVGWGWDGDVWKIPGGVEKSNKRDSSESLLRDPWQVACLARRARQDEVWTPESRALIQLGVSCLVAVRDACMSRHPDRRSPLERNDHKRAEPVGSIEAT